MVGLNRGASASSVIHETARSDGETRILEQVPKRRVGVGDASDHGAS
jgi:hypothetical protein